MAPAGHVGLGHCPPERPRPQDRTEGLGRLPPAQQRKRKSGTFKDYDLGFVHMDIKHLPKLQTAGGERRKRYLYVAIDRCSRWVRLAVYDDELTTSTVAS